MALLDRLRPQPGWKHPDPATRLAAVEALPVTDQATLAIVARDDDTPRIRRAAVARLEDLDALQAVARADADDQVKQDAQGRLTAQAIQVEDEARAQRALAALTDARSLATVARSAAAPAVALGALARVTESTAIASVARQAEHEAVRLQALARLNDPGDLEAVATRSEHKDVGLAALERLSAPGTIGTGTIGTGTIGAGTLDTATLDGIALRARNKVVARRAKAIVKERAAADADARTVADALAKRRGQLIEAVDALARARDRTRIQSEREYLAQQWRDLPAPPADVAERWERSMERVRMQYDELTQQEALVAEQRAAREAGTAQRRTLIDAVAAIADEEPGERLGALRAEWQALPPLDAPDAAALDREFTRAIDAQTSRATNRVRLAEAQTRLAEIATEVTTLAEAPEQDAVRPRWQALTQEWRDLTSGLPIDPALQAQHQSAVARWKGRDNEAREVTARQAAEQSAGTEAQLQQLLERSAALAANAEAPLKDLERAVRDLRLAIDKPGPLSTAATETLLPKLRTAAADLSPRLRELKDTDEWRRWANAGIQDELCKRIEGLRELTDLAEVARQLRDLRRQWKAVAAAPRDEADGLWQRFKTAADELQAKVDAHFATVAVEHAENIAKKLALCDQAEALAQSTDWIATAETLKRLQAEWQAVGAVPKDQAAEVARRFRTACDTFFTRRKSDLSHRKEEWSDNQKKKETLCARMEELAESSDWNTTFNEIKKLQADWKAVGPVRRNKSEALWKRFRGACDRFFERYGKRHEIDLQKRVEEREAICRELEALAPSFAVEEQAIAVEPAAPVAADPLSADAEPAAAVESIVESLDPAEAPIAAAEHTPEPVTVNVAATVDEVWRRWRTLPGVPPEAFTPLRARFESALTTVLTSFPGEFKGTPFDLQATHQRMQALCDEVEGVGKGGAGAAQPGGSSVTALAMLLKESLAANTIGGRVNEEAKARAAFERVRRAQSAWRNLGPAIGNDAHALESRFHRACRRFYEQNPQFEQTARGPQGGHGGHGGGHGHGDREHRGGHGGGQGRDNRGGQRPSQRQSQPPSR